MKRILSELADLAGQLIRIDAGRLIIEPGALGNVWAQARAVLLGIQNGR